MFIALPSHSFALQRSAMCFSGFRLHAAPDGAGYVRNLGAINMLLLRSKSFGTNWSKSFGTNSDDFSCKSPPDRNWNLPSGSVGVQDSQLRVIELLSEVAFSCA